MEKAKTLIWIVILTILMVPTFLVGQGFAADPARLVWNEVIGDYDGITIHYGTIENAYDLSHEVGKVTEFPLSELPGMKSDL